MNRISHQLRFGARSLLAVVVLWAGTIPLAVPSNAQDLYPLIFPVVGENTYTDTFGAPRSGGRTHEGTDILADKMVPVVAAASGTVGWMHDEIGGNCCAMELRHDDGWESWYIHLNNDTPGTDDGLGFGFADGVVEGARIEAGQLIGWVGDSGNAEATVSHLHFELHDPDGVVVNPYEHLVAATIMNEPGGDANSVGPFIDDEGSVHEPNIIRLADLGITTGCTANMFCPDDLVTRAQMATFLARALDLPDADADTFTDDDGNPHEANIEALAAAGITLGCGNGRFCPQQPVSRAEMATFLVRGFGLAAASGDTFPDDDGISHEPNIEALAAAEITLGCGDGNYCPDVAVNRGQMATFIIRAIDHTG